MIDKYEYDYRLFQRCALDDVEAKDELFRVYKPFIIKRVATQVPEAVINDIVSEVCVKLLVSISKNQYKGNSSLQTYIFRIVVFAIADFWRKEYRRRDKEMVFAATKDDVDTLSDIHRDYFIEADLINHLLSQVNTESQRAFVRLMLNGLSFGEASKSLGITYEAGRSRYRRALDCMKAYVVEYNILEVE